MIQTYHPEHYSILAAQTQNYEDFYQQEIRYRMLMDYPPAAAMAAVRGACTDEALLKEAMSYCRKYVKRILSKRRFGSHRTGAGNGIEGAGLLQNGALYAPQGPGNSGKTKRRSGKIYCGQ